MTTRRTLRMSRWLAVRLATLLVAGCGAAWWLVDVAPPHALIGLFDPGFEPGTPLTPVEALEVMLPAEVRDAARAAIVAALGEATKGIGEVRELAKGHVVILPFQDDVDRAELERMLSGTQGRFEIVPVIDEGERVDAFHRFAREQLALAAPERSLLVAASEVALRAGLRAAAADCGGCALASDEAVLIEHSAARPEFEQEEQWRALLVSRAPPVFDQRLLETAFASYNDRNEPIVIVTMTPDGATRFAALTEAHLDERLAIAIGEVVLMAPVIRGVITGGHVEISLGGSTSAALNEAHALVAQLLPGLQLPAGTTWQWRQLMGADPGAVHAAEVITVALAMLLALMLVVVGRRALRPELAPASSYAGEPVKGEAGRTLLRFVATVALGASVVLLAKIPIPLPEAHIMWGEGSVSAPSVDTAGVFNLAALGLPSIFLGHLLVALVVALVPPLERFRGSGLAARRALLPATLLTTFALATLQGLVMAQALRAYPAIDTTGAAIGLVALMLAAGVLVLWAIAAAISRFGVGNGFVVLSLGLVGASLASLEEPLPSPLGAALLMLAGLTLLLTCLRVRAGSNRNAAAGSDGSGTRRLPLTGLVPLDLGATLIGLMLVFGPLFRWQPPDVTLTPALALALLVALGGLFSWLLARPIALVAWLPATLVGLALLVLIVVAHARLAGADDPMSVDLSWFVSIVTLPVLLTDVGGELALWLRRGPLVRVASTSDVDLAGRWLDALAAAGIAATLRGVRMRSLTRFMGPWLPVEVLVPAAASQAARTALRDHTHGDILAPFGD